MEEEELSAHIRVSRRDPAKAPPPLNSALKYFGSVLDLLYYSCVLVGVFWIYCIFRVFWWNEISKTVFETQSSIALK